MLVRRTTLHLETELLKWAILFALASAIVLGFVVQTVSAGPPGKAVEPRGIPDSMLEAARPMSSWRDPNETASQRPFDSPAADDDAAAPTKLWQALEHHRRHQYKAAQRIWQDVELTCEMEPWRQIALGSAHLREAEMDAAIDAFERAHALDPHNPLAPYHMGLLRLMQSAGAEQWYDAIGPSNTRLVAAYPRRIAPNSKSMYKLAAMMRLREALESAPYVEQWLEAPLTNSQLYSKTGPTDAVIPPPTVKDLLRSIDAVGFEAETHRLLATLHLERSSLENAEKHLDAAANHGLPMGPVYRDLGRAFEEQGRNLDASRAYLKAMSRGGGISIPLMEALRSLGRALDGAAHS